MTAAWTPSIALDLPVASDVTELFISRLSDDGSISTVMAIY